MNYRKPLIFVMIALFMLSFSVLSAQETPECEAGFRLIEHEMGETCIPEDPQRVVALDMAVVELLLLADKLPVAGSSVVFDSFTATTPAIKPALDAILEHGVDVGFPPNMEAVLSAAPDLIVAPRDFIGEMLYPHFSAITATVLYDPIPGNWRSRVRIAGEIIGESELAESLIADFDARVAEFIEVMPETEVPLEISLVRTWPNQVGVSLEGTAGAALILEVGLARPEGQRLDYEYVLNELDGWVELRISDEEMMIADGDIIFVFGNPSLLDDNVLWQALPGVADGRAFPVGYHWWGDSLINAHLMLDDLFTYVAQTEPVLPNPFLNGIPNYELEAESAE